MVAIDGNASAVKATRDLYARVRSHPNSTLPNQRMNAALLTAVEQTISERGLEPSPTAYFATLMTLLSEMEEEDLEQEQAGVESITYLLGIAMEKLPSLVLREKLEETGALLMEMLQRHSEHHAITRHLLECIAHLLLVQDAPAWSTATLSALLHAILARIADARPKVRKLAQVCMLKILEQPPPPMVYHPANVAVARFLVQVLRECKEETVILHLVPFLKELWRFLKSAQNVEQLASILVQLKSYGNVHILAMSFEALQQWLTCWIDGQLLAEISMEKFRSVFYPALMEMKPNVHDSRLMPLWLSLIAQMMVLISEKDALMAADLLPKTFDAVFDLLQLTPHTKAAAKAVHLAITETLAELLEKCVTEEMILEAVTAHQQSPELVAQHSAPLLKVLAKVEKGLSLAFQSGWFVVLDTIRMLLDRFYGATSVENAAFLLLSPILQILSDDTVYSQNKHFAHHEMLQNVLGTAIRVCGPRLFLSLFPLNMVAEESTGESRTWLLPLLKEYVCNTELKYFVDVFIPLAQQIAERGQKLVLGGNAVDGKTCAIVWRQIWDLLPGFCHAPLDLKESFEPLCTIIIPMLTSNDDRVPSICEALRLFVNRNNAIANNEDAKDKQGLAYRQTTEMAGKDLQFLSGYAQHILPPLFSKFVDLHSAESIETAENVSVAQMRDVVLETIRSWISIADLAVINQFFEATMKKYLSMEDTGKEAAGQKHALFDLSLAILASKRLEMDAIQVLVRILVLGMRNQEDAAIQKKSYKAWCLLFEYATTANADGDDSLLERARKIEETYWASPTFLQELITQLTDASVSVGSAAKKDRLQLMAIVVACLKWDAKNADAWSKLLSFIPAVMSEAILLTKEVSEKVRGAAFLLMLTMGRKLMDIERESDGQAQITVHMGRDEDDEGAVENTSMSVPANLNEFTKMIMAGLAGKTPHMISATIHVLARFLYEFRDQLDGALVRTVVQVVLMYARESRSREIIKSAISFIKVVVVVCADLLQAQNEDVEMEEEDMESSSFLQRIVEALLKWSSEHKSHFKVACRYIVEKLVRKFGYDAVEPFFPEEHHKLLTNIRKTRERKLRKAAAGKEAAASASREPQSFQDLMKEQGSDEEMEGDAAVGSDEDDEEEEGLPEMLRELVGAGHFARGKGKQVVAIQEGGEEDPVDFLDRKVISKLYTKEGAKGSGKKQRQRNGGKELPRGEDGRLIIRDEDSADEGSLDPEMEKQVRALRLANRQYMESVQSKDGFQHTADGKRLKFAGNTKKRVRDDGEEELRDDYEDDDAGGDTDLGNKNQPGNRGGAKRGVHNSKRRMVAEKELAKANVRSTGKEYRGKKARGDIKRADMPDPFAYIPLNPKIVASQRGKKKTVRLNKKLFDI